MQGLTEGSSDKLESVRNGLADELVHLCPTCGLTTANIKDDEFSCRGGLTDYIVYRARIVGTDTYSAPGLVSLMQSWVDSGRASIMVQSSRLHLDPTCDASLDTLKAPDCESPGEESSTTTESSAEAAAAKTSGASVGEIGGIAVGVLIAVLLIILIVLVVLVIMWKMKSKLSIRYKITSMQGLFTIMLATVIKGINREFHLLIIIVFSFSTMLRKFNEHSRMPKDSDLGSSYADVRRYVL